jgi:hypothetical protein
MYLLTSSTTPPSEILSDCITPVELISIRCEHIIDTPHLGVILPVEKSSDIDVILPKKRVLSPSLCSTSKNIGVPFF